MARKALRYFPFFALLALALTLMLSMAAAAQEPQTESPQPRVPIEWQDGPSVGNLGGIAEVNLPAGYRFTGKAGALRVMEITHNPSTGKELGVVIPAGEEPKWFMTFEFDDRGYVEDNDRNLDADAILKSIQDGTEHANELRKQRGWKPFHVTGWEHTPYYDPMTHNLTWAIKGRGDDPTETTSINHSIRLLGRHGTMNVDLVVAPEDYSASTAQMAAVLGGFSYVQGSRYSDFTKGDKIAAGGLAALIAVGGAGLLIKFWKPIAVGLVALAGAIKKFFSSIFGSKETKIQQQPPPPQPPPPQPAVQG